MKKFISVFIVVVTSLILISPANAEVMLQGGVSLSSQVPMGFFGAWKVISERAKTNNPNIFAPYSVDIWNFSKANDVITLSNPVSGAKASVTIDEVNNDTVTFVKTSYDTDEKCIETPILTLGNDNFYGIDRIEVLTYQKGKLIKSEFVEYQIRAEKISGANIPSIFGK